MSQKAKTIWYIEPLDKPSNRILFDWLGAEAIQEAMPTADKPRDLYQVRGYPDVLKCLSNSDLVCSFWKKVDPDSPIVHWPVPENMKRKKKAKASK